MLLSLVLCNTYLIGNFTYSFNSYSNNSNSENNIDLKQNVLQTDRNKPVMSSHIVHILNFLVRKKRRLSALLIAYICFVTVSGLGSCRIIPSFFFLAKCCRRQYVQDSFSFLMLSRFALLNILYISVPFIYNHYSN